MNEYKWIKSALDKSFNSSSPFDKVLEQIHRTLRNHISLPISERQQQALFLLLGRDTTEYYFPEVTYNDKLLEPPNTRKEEKEEYIRESKKMLLRTIQQSMKDVGYPNDVSEYLRHDDDLGIIIDKIRATVKHELWNEMSHKYRPSFKLRNKITIESTGNRLENASKILCKLMMEDSTKIAEVIDRVIKRNMALPNSLRQCVWWYILLSNEKYETNDLLNIQNEMKREFEETVTSNKLKQGKFFSNSEINDHVFEVQDSKIFRDIPIEDISVTSARALVALQTYNKGYSPTQIYTVIPLYQVFYEKNPKGNDVSLLSIVVYLHTKYFQIDSQSVFTISSKIMNKLNTEDPDYGNTITKSFKNNDTQGYPKDFLPGVIADDIPLTLDIFNDICSGSLEVGEKVKKNYSKQLSQPEIYLRKWLSQAFVGILKNETLLFVWDQLFSSEWSAEIYIAIGCAILALIKPAMLQVTKFSEARRVFITEPFKIYTSDLKSAIRHFKQNGKYGIDITKSGTKRNIKIMSRDMPVKSRIREPTMVHDGPRDALEVLDLKEPVDINEPIPHRVPKRDILSSDSEDEYKNLAIEPHGKRKLYSPPTSPPHKPSSASSAWVKHVPKKTIKDLSIEAIDLYIDSLRFLPDNIAVCKICCQVFNTRQAKKIGTMAYPVLNGYQRCPTFRKRITIDKQSLSPTMIVMFRIYGYQKTTNNIVVVGTALIQPFNVSDGKFVFKIGGHQMRLYYEKQEYRVDPKPQQQGDFDKNPIIPACSICIRFLPSDSTFHPIPKYEDGYYESSRAVPNDSEIKLLRYYTNTDGYSTRTVSDELKTIQTIQSKQITTTDISTYKYLKALLDHKALLKKTEKSIPNIKYSQFVKYDRKYGLNICILKASDMPDGYYMQCIAEVHFTRSDREALGDELSKLRVVTSQTNLTSPQNYPEWNDDGKKIHPIYRENAYLLIKIFGIKLKVGANSSKGFLPNISALFKGDKNASFTVTENEDATGITEPIFWAVMPLFTKGYVRAGEHSLALFKGRPSYAVLIRLEKEGNIEDILHKCVSQKETVPPEKTAYLQVECWDGHFEADDIPEERQKEQLLKFQIDENIRISPTGSLINILEKHMKIDEKLKKSEKENFIAKESQHFIKQSNKLIFDAINEYYDQIGHLPIDV